MIPFVYVNFTRLCVNPQFDWAISSVTAQGKLVHVDVVDTHVIVVEFNIVAGVR